ncbi:hypothetical protein BDZ45DRAFT_661857 [Acephala macrosclerotiorum]|nr:hypothetical protein BDZ45DRAFT_661857 [Acephala macrosclerotiorum]
MYGTFTSHHGRQARSNDIEHQAGHPHTHTARSIDETTDDDRQPLLSSDAPSDTDTLSIHVGTGSSSSIFNVSRVVICQYSGHITSLCDSSHSPSDPITVAANPAVFSLFVDWLVAQPTPISFDPDRPAVEPWVSLASAACILASELDAPAFEKYALSQFIQNVALAPFVPWADIERDAPVKSSIRRFSNHWIAWNAHLAGSGPNEFSELAAAQLASRVTDQTRDPRLYHIDHWYSDCGDSFEPGCEHHPAQNAEHRPTKPMKPRQGQQTGSSEEERVYRPRTPTMVMQRPRIKTPPPQHRSDGCCDGCCDSCCNNCCDDCCDNCCSEDDCTACCACGMSSLIVILFAGIVATILALSIIILHHDDAGIRYTTRTYTLFVACFGLMVLLGPAERVLGWYLLFAFADGIALAVDNNACWSYNPTPDCQKMTALTVLTWTNLVMAMIYVGFCSIIRD